MKDIQQLIKKDNQQGKYTNIYPKTYTDAIIDKESGKSLHDILLSFNMYFLNYTGNTATTRLKVPAIVRKRGLWITYVKYDNNVYTEWYAGEQTDDASWQDSANWRVGNSSLVGDITISSNGNWIVNGVETQFKAIGEAGISPILRIQDNKLQVSYNQGTSYTNISDTPIYTRFRWQATTGSSQSSTIGRIQASTDNGKSWTNMSDDFINNLHISKYIGANESLPTSGIPVGTIYAKGPTYAEDDTNNNNPIYRLWVYAYKGDTLAWQDNGEFTSILSGVVQELGDSETEVVSQKVITDELSEVRSLVDMNMTDIKGIKYESSFVINANTSKTIRVQLNVKSGTSIKFGIYNDVGIDSGLLVSFKDYNNNSIYEAYYSQNKEITYKVSKDCNYIEFFFASSIFTSDANITIKINVKSFIDDLNNNILSMGESINNNILTINSIDGIDITDTITIITGKSATKRVNINVKSGEILEYKISNTSYSYQFNCFDLDGNIFYSQWKSPNISYKLTLEKNLSQVSFYFAASSLATVDEEAIINVKVTGRIKELQKQIASISTGNNFLIPIFPHNSNLEYPISMSPQHVWPDMFNRDIVEDSVYDIVEFVRGNTYTFAYYDKLYTGKDNKILIELSLRTFSNKFIINSQGTPTDECDEEEFINSYKEYITSNYGKFDGVQTINFQQGHELYGKPFTYKARIFQISNELDALDNLKNAGFGISSINDGSGNCTEVSDNKYFYADIAKKQAIKSFRLAYRAIKQAFPDSLVLSNASTSTGESEYYINFNKQHYEDVYIDTNGIKHHSWEYFDVLNVHYYDNSDAENIISKLANLKKIINNLDTNSNGEYFSSKPIWITEIGKVNSKSLTQQSEESDEDFNLRCEVKDKKQAEDLVKSFIIAYSLGVEKINVYAINDPLKIYNLVEVQTAEGGNITKYYPAYDAFKVLKKIMGNNSTYPKLSINGDIYSANWENNGRNITAIWSSSDINHTLIPGYDCQIIDLYGNNISNSNIELGKSPIYLFDCMNYSIT